MNRSFKRPPAHDLIRKPLEFVAVFLGIFFLAALFLFWIDFVPEAPNASATDSPDTKTSSATITASKKASAQMYPIEDPTRVVIPAVGIDTLVTNPSSTNTDTLDTALLKGAVRYPESGLAGENARMYIFGHQSYLPVVHNQAFKAFNGLQKVKPGDEVVVYTATGAYQYRVSTIQHVLASTGEVQLGSGDRTLTLTTCDSFGTKSDRYEVEAEFIGPISASNTAS